MSVKAFNKDKESFVKIASLQSRDIAVDKSEFVSNNVSDALAELKRDLKAMQSNIAWIYNNGTIGGGGGGSDTGSGYTGIIQVENFDSEKNLILQDAEAATVVFKVASKLNTAFSVKITIGALTKTVSVMPNVSTTVNMGQVSKGTHEVIITGEDYTGFPMETWRGYVIKGLISLSTTFNSDYEYEMTASPTIPFLVELSSAVSHRALYVSYSLDGGEEIELSGVKPNVTSYIKINTEGGQMKMGEHKVLITAKIPDVSGLNFITATLEVPVRVYDLNHISLYVPNTTASTYTLENVIAIPFGIIAHNTYNSFTINWEVHPGTGLSSAKESGSADFYRGTNTSITLTTTSANGYSAGKYTLRLWGTVKGQNIPSVEDCLFTFELKEQSTSITEWSIVEDALIANFDARTQISLGANNAWTNTASNNIYNVACTIVNPMEAPFVHSASINNPQENDLLRLFGESYAYVNFNPFAQGLTNTGFTIDMVYRCSNNGDYSAVVASCAGYSVGTSVTMTEGFCIDANAINSTYANNTTNAPLMEDEWIHCTIVYEPMKNDSSQLFTKIYLNGVLSAAINSNRSVSTAYPSEWNGIYLGARYYWETEADQKVDHIDKFADVEFKSFRLYSKALNQQEVAINYIADDYYMQYDESGNYDAERNLKLRNAAAFDENKNFNVANSKLPRVYVWFNDLTTTERFIAITADTTRNEAIVNEKVACYLRYENMPNSVNDQVRFDTRQWNSSQNNTQINNTFIKVQGTTSLTYNHKNYDISFGTWADSNKEVLFSPKWGTPGKQWLPENTFTLKADLIDSSHANNVGTAKAITAISEAAGLREAIKPMIAGNNTNHADVKFAIDGFPCLLYVYDNALGDYFNADQPGTPTLYGVYMFDLGRTSYYNLGMLDVQIDEMNAAQGNVGCIATNYTVKSESAKEGEMYYPENTLVYEGNANSTAGSSISFETTDSATIQKEWDQRYPTAATQTGLTKLQTAIANVFNWDTGSEGADQFASGAIWHKTTCITYLLCAYVFGMVDNLGKNLQVKTWDGTQWFPMFYDLDTVLGLNNTGGIYYGSNIDLDKYGEDQADHQLLNRTESSDAFYELTYGAEGGDGRGLGLYNTANSKLWNAVRSPRMWYGTAGEDGVFTADSFRWLYNNLRVTRGVLNHDTLYEFYSSIMDKIGITFFNIDAETKYLDYYTRINESGENETGYNNINMMHGTRELLTKRWLRDRLRYLDSLFELYTNTPNTSVTLQTRNSWVSGNYTTGVKTTCPVFTRQLQDSTSADAIKIALTDKYYYTNYVCAEEKVTNRQFLYNNANLITNLRGINTTQLGEMLINTANSLLELDVSNSTQLTTLILSGLKSLRYLNCSYCPFGGSNTTNSLDLSKSTALQEVNISYSGVTNMPLPAGGTLKKINASNTKLTKIEVVTQTMLEELDLSNCGDLAELELTKCDSLKRVIITNSALTNVRIIGCPSLEEVILTDNKRLSQVSFEDCDNIKILDLSGCTLSNFATYTGDESVDTTTALNLVGCPNLEELGLENCSAQVIKLSDKCTTLKKINGKQSQWTQTVIASFDNATVFSTYNTGSEICPAIDLGKFASLESINFQSNAYVQAITNLTYAGAGASIFRYCSNLRRITGHITIQSSNSRMFGDMSDKFRLNSAYTSTPDPENASTLNVPLKLSIANNVTTLSETFYGNKGITLRDAQYVCGVIPSTVTTAASVFTSTQLQAKEYTSESIPPTILVKSGKGATGLVNTSSMFSAAGLKGTFPSEILMGCPKLTHVDGMFAYNGFSALDSNFSSYLFTNNRSLQNCSSFLINNSSLKNTSATPVQLSELFKNNPELTTCYGFLGYTLTVENSGYVTEDSYMNVMPRRDLYIHFGTNGDEVFANNPKLTNCSLAFAKCKALGTMHENIFGGVNPNQTTAGKTGYYSNKLTNVSFCFHDCDVTTTLTNKLFANQPQLENVAGFVSGGLSGTTVNQCSNVTGDLTTLTSLFAKNPLLTNARRFFESTGVTGEIPSGTSTAASALFANNTALQNANYLFRNATAIVGSFPTNLFGNCSNLSTIKGLFYGCTGMTGSIPGSSDTSLYLFKCLTSDDNKFKSLGDVSELFYGCSSMSSTIPTNLFEYTPNISTVAKVFMGCGSQASTIKGVTGAIPENLLATMPNLVDVSYLFSGCWNLSPTVVNGTNYSTPVNENGISTLFANNMKIVNAAGLLQKTKVYNIPQDLFSNANALQNVSYMFNQANRSEAIIPSVLFDRCNNISNIACFAGEQGIGLNPAYGFTTFPNDIFKPYSSGSLVGQKYISNVFCAFRNNDAATGEAILFDQWNNPPTSFAGCYNLCSALTNIDNVPDNYKTPA